MNPHEVQGDVDLDYLYLPLLASFSIIVIGYIVGRCKIISHEQTQGLSTYLAKFTLPPLVFVSLAELEISTINWFFMTAILTGKIVVYLLVVVTIMCVWTPIEWGKCALYSIFCTQSNDFAIGYPIMQAVYGGTHADYVEYLYLLAPINMMILNPISLVMAEVTIRRSAGHSLTHTAATIDISIEASIDIAATATSQIPRHARAVLRVGLSVLTNPTVMMSILGLVTNRTIDPKTIPLPMSILRQLGAGFGPTSLFTLGLRMVGKIAKLRGAGIVVPSILIATKLFVCPFVFFESITLWLSKKEQPETRDLCSYGLLYGTLPAAPVVFAIATQYHIDEEIISSSMALCTIMSAPLIYIAAHIISQENIIDYMITVNPLQFIRSFKNNE